VDRIILIHTIKLHGIKFFVLSTIFVFETSPEPINLVELQKTRNVVKDALSKNSSLRSHRARRYIDASEYMEDTYHEIYDSKWTVYPDGRGNYIIPFTISANYGKSERKMILETMRELEKNICIRFRERRRQKDYIYLRSGEGCASTVGYKEGKTEVSLEKDGCIDQPSIFHELLHVIGADHEHQRLDRDRYIKVHWENLKPNEEQNFIKEAQVPEDLIYDYESIMHYEEDAFAKEGTITIKTLDPHFQHIIGKAKEPSVLDYAKICVYYDCVECMGLYDWYYKDVQHAR
ncbi:unnamed protein product, partial [Cylicocyclus nassatus]